MTSNTTPPPGADFNTVNFFPRWNPQIEIVDALEVRDVNLQQFTAARIDTLVASNHFQQMLAKVQVGSSNEQPRSLHDWVFQGGSEAVNADVLIRNDGIIIVRPDRTKDNAPRQQFIRFESMPPAEPQFVQQIAKFCQETIAEINRRLQQHEPLAHHATPPSPVATGQEPARSSSNAIEMVTVPLNAIQMVTANMPERQEEKRIQRVVDPSNIPSTQQRRRANSLPLSKGSAQIIPTHHRRDDDEEQALVAAPQPPPPPAAPASKTGGLVRGLLSIFFRPAAIFAGEGEQEEAYLTAVDAKAPRKKQQAANEAQDEQQRPASDEHRLIEL